MKLKHMIGAACLVVGSTNIAFAQIPEKLAEDAYLYAYSMDEAYQFFYETAVKPDYPLNRFQNIRNLADDTYTAHPTINNDTLHLMGWLDVAQEPVIVSVPNMNDDRYWILHTMDMGHYTDSMFGSRTRGKEGGQFMYASPTWKGEVPASVDEVVRVDSNFVKLMGRIMANGPEDTQIAQSYMDQWNIRTLSEYLGKNGPKPLVRHYPDPATSTWLETTNFVLCEGNLAQADKQWLQQYKSVGLEACKYEFNNEQLKMQTIGKEQGLKRIAELSNKVTDARLILGTRKSLGDSERGIFSVGTYVGQWGLPPEEAAYRKLEKDPQGNKLNGAKHSYTMRFKAPDVSEFWSVTVYGADNRLMAKNDLNRHSRGDRTLTADKDGYYTITLSADEKANKNKSNYLPIPEKDFYLVMRLYGASESVQKGDYQMPEATISK
jgi:hypothetical protein